jgi:DNA polymerase-1
LHILDIETDGIDPKKLWCIVTKDITSGSVATYSFPSGVPAEYPEVLKGFLSSKTSAWIGHNIISYDLPILSRFIPEFTYDRNCVVDTLVVCRLLHYNIAGGNSLEAWGDRLGFPKTNFKAFHAYSDEMLDYCVQDVLVTEKLYAFFSEYITSSQWSRSLRLEHDTAWLCNSLHDSGFAFDAGRASDLLRSVEELLRGLDNELRTAFLPRTRLIREIHPRVTASGALSRVDFRWLCDPSDLTTFNGGPFSRFEYLPFNPGSPKQCVERLNECGWRPVDKTRGHISAERALGDYHRRGRVGGTGRSGGRVGGRPADGAAKLAALEAELDDFRVYGWKINPTNLATLPSTAPKAAHKLVEWLTLESRRSTLVEWLSAYNTKSGRIHGRFNHIGAWTGRMSHNSPNMANIPGHGSLMGDEMRSLWRADEGTVLCGVDADGIQLRILAHYMEDEAFIQALTKGSKDDGTDAHTLNQKALGGRCKSRDVAKTFIYAFLLGAGTGKISQILECSELDAKEAVQNFLNYYPGLRDLRQYRIPSDAARGYFVGLDGRLVACDSEHLMLAGYLQNGEAVVMKTANLIWRRKLEEENIPYRQVNFVHDEWQTQFQNLTDATKGSIIKVSAIAEAGLLLKVKCPLAGNSILGTNWLETH